MEACLISEGFPSLLLVLLFESFPILIKQVKLFSLLRVRTQVWARSDIL